MCCLESACNLSHMLCMCDNVKQQRRIITQSPEAIFLKTLSCCNLVYLSLFETSIYRNNVGSLCTAKF